MPATTFYLVCGCEVVPFEFCTREMDFEVCFFCHFSRLSHNRGLYPGFGMRNRFEKAESLLGDSAELTSQPKVASATGERKEKKQVKPEKVIRDSFTLPSGDYELIAAIRQRCLNSALNVNKSEVIRAGLHFLNKVSDEELMQVFKGLEKIKTGRPKAI